MKSGILEVTDDELVHYQSNSEPIRWSYRCLRRYGMGMYLISTSIIATDPGSSLAEL